jgi:hypothetical protein
VEFPHPISPPTRWEVESEDGPDETAPKSGQESAAYDMGKSQRSGNAERQEGQSASQNDDQSADGPKENPGPWRTIGYHAGERKQTQRRDAPGDSTRAYDGLEKQIPPDT